VKKRVENIDGVAAIVLTLLNIAQNNLGVDFMMGERT
jgi:hypothetical protein